MINERRITKESMNNELSNMDKELVEYIRLHLDSRDKDCERHMKLDITDCDIAFIVEKVRKYDAFVEKCRTGLTKTNKTDGMFMSKDIK